MWVTVTSTVNDGVYLKTATVTNCLFYKCNMSGLWSDGTGGKVYNCISYKNNDNGFVCTDKGNLLVVNSISMENYCGFYGHYGTLNARYCNSYGNNWYNYAQLGGSYMIKTSCLEVDPGFSPDAWRLSNTSLCKDAGDPTIFDLDGTHSDMGYYGGPDAPLLPYITMPINYKLNPDGTIQFDMQGKVGY